MQTFAEQAVIAIGSAETYRELQARTAALAERNSEYGERIEHQSATIDVLKAMSASPDNTQPVFDLIARRARELCNGASWACANSMASWSIAAGSGESMPDAIAAFQGMFPMGRHVEPAGRAILDRRVVHIPRHERRSRDAQAVAEPRRERRLLGCRCCATAGRSARSR